MWIKYSRSVIIHTGVVGFIDETCKTKQVLLAGVQGGFSRGSPVFAHLLIGPSHTCMS